MMIQRFLLLERVLSQLSKHIKEEDKQYPSNSLKIPQYIGLKYMACSNTKADSIEI